MSATRDDSLLIEFNKALATQAIDNYLELYLNGDDFDVISKSKNIDSLPPAYFELIKHHDLLGPFHHVPPKILTATKSGKSDHSLFFESSNNDQYICIFNQDICQFDLAYATSEFRRTGLLKLRSQFLANRFFFFTTPDDLDKLIIGCGHRSHVIQNCRDHHDAAMTIDAYASADPDIVYNVETHRPMKLNEPGFNTILFEGVDLPLNIKLLSFLIINLSPSGIVTYDGNQYTREVLERTYRYFVDDPKDDKITSYATNAKGIIYF